MPDIKIDADTFSIEPLSAGDAFDLQPLIMPVVAQLLGGLLEAGLDDGKLLAQMGDTSDEDSASLIAKLGPHIANAVAHAFSQITTDKMKTVRLKLLSSARMNGSSLFGTQGNAFDVLLRGKSVTTWKLIIFALRLNYPDFFGLFSGAVEAAAKENSSTSPSA